jgi:hypothetical protein
MPAESRLGLGHNQDLILISANRFLPRIGRLSAHCGEFSIHREAWKESLTQQRRATVRSFHQHSTECVDDFEKPGKLSFIFTGILSGLFELCESL